MNVRRIGDPLTGEHVLGTEPELAPAVDAGWRRRLNLYTGRSLSDIALITQQGERAGRLATRGQMVSPGVVTGLEVGVESMTASGSPVLQHFYTIAAGIGITSGGEDVVLPTAVHVNVKDVRVYAPASLLGDSGTGAGSGSGSAGTGAGGLAARRLGPPLGDLVTNGVSLPPVGILLLQPVAAEMIGAMDPTDPCEQSAQNDPFDDQQIVDGCRLVLYTWPAEWQTLPAGDGHWRNTLAYFIFNLEMQAGGGQLPAWVDASVRKQEQGRLQPWTPVGLPRPLLPWEEVGVPIALVAFDGSWTPLFVDRSSVARAAGRPRARSPWLPNAGSPLLWQARLQQYAEHLNELILANQSIATITPQFRYLPPVGLMPVETAQPRQGQVHYVFPPSYVATIKPVPLEQLDVVMTESASLAPFDLSVPDGVEILVPVPQIWYEPNLLETEGVDPAFQQAIDTFNTGRADWLQRRDDVQSKQAVVAQVIAGTAPPPITPDPDRLADEFSLVHLSILKTGFHQHSFFGANPPLIPKTGETLFAYVCLDPQNAPTEVMLQWTVGASDREHRAFWGANTLNFGPGGTATSYVPMGGLPAAGTWTRLEVPAAHLGLEGAQITGIAFMLNDGRAAWGPAGTLSPQAGGVTEVRWVDAALPAGAQGSVSLLGAMPVASDEGWAWSDVTVQPFRPIDPPENDYQTALQNGVRIAAPMPNLINTLQNTYRLTQADIAGLNGKGLQAFIDDLQQRVRQADDVIDFGFLRVQTDIYRHRQLMLNNVDATRLATSPALASIAQGESAVVTQEQLQTFLTAARSSQRVTNPPISSILGGNIAALAMTSTVAAGGGPGSSFGGGGPVVNTVDKFAVGATVHNGNATMTVAKTQPGLAAEAAIGSFASTTPASSAQIVAALPSALTGTSVSAFAVRSRPVFVDGSADDGEVILHKTPIPPKKTIVDQSPVVGETYDFRTVTVAQRLEDPKAPEARAYALASKYAVVTNLAGLNISVDDILVPNIFVGTSTVTDPETQKPVQVPVRQAQSFADLRKSGFAGILNDPNPANADEAGFFGSGVQILDDTIMTLRSIEGRVKSYRLAIDACQQVIDSLQTVAPQIDQRLAAIAHGLAEARYNVEVAQGLLADEQRRVAGVNARRDAIIKEHVTFLAFRRPRYSDLLADVPARALDPDVMDATLPACAGQAAAMPAELRSMVQLLRDAPVRWFTHIPPLLDRFDRLDILQNTIQLARGRAALHYAPSQAAVALPAMPTVLGRAINTVFTSQRQVVAQYRLQTSALDLSNLLNLTWQNTREQAKQIVSLGDLIDAGHGRSDVSQDAAREFNNIADVSGCLYELFGQVLPVIRLDWAERLGQYEQPVNLRNLSSLPRWSEVDPVHRREIQTLVDWLYQQVDAYQSDAVSMISDLVRVCILVASHAPVNQIIAGHVARPAPVKVGGRVTLNIDPVRVHVGMHVLMYQGPKMVARGLVEDLATGQAAARVIQVNAENVNLDEGAIVHFAEPSAF